MQLPSTKDTADRGQAVVLGLGCGGGRIAAGLFTDQETEAFRIVTLDTDRKDLQAIPGATTVHLGREWNLEDGCGGDPELGERIVSGAEEILLEHIRQTPLLIVVAGLGAGTGTGGAQALARIVRNHQIPALFVLTLPFSFEGNWPRRQAETALQNIRNTTDTVMVVHNDLLFTAVAADIPARQAFLQIDHMLAKAIYGLLGIAWADWLLKADLATIRNLLQQHPEKCFLGFGLGKGENRWREAVESFVACPLLGGPENIGQTNAAVITVGNDEDISVAELRQCMAAIQQYFPDNTRLLIGAYASPMHVDEVQITGVCCHFDDRDKNRPDRLPQTDQDSGNSEDDKHHSSPSIGNRRKGSRKKTGKQAPIQEELPFQEEMLGLFSGSPPTIYQGENLDAPTFQRRGIKLDLGWEASSAADHPDA